MAKFCMKCGAQINEGSKFCASCGTPVPQPQPQSVQPPRPQPAQPQPEQPVYGQPQPQYAARPQTPQPQQYVQPTYQQSPQPRYAQPQQGYAPQQAGYVQPQPQFGQGQYAQTAPPAKKKKGKGWLIALIAVVLTAAIIAAIVVIPWRGKNGDIIRAEVTFPKASLEEGVMDSVMGVTVNYYLAARASLDKLAEFDFDHITVRSAAEFGDLLRETIGLFEDVEKLSGLLDETAVKWIESDDEKKPTYQKLSSSSPAYPFVTPVSAAPDSSALAWAKEITEKYDKAPVGRGVRTLAEQLGTDAKHAYAQLKQAQAILEGSAFSDFAEYSNNCYKAAMVAKTAGTAAGLVIAVAAAPAAAAIGPAVKTGCVVCSGINTVLEIGETSSVIRANGEDTDFALACRKTESQMAPITTFFNVAKVGLAAKDLAKLGGDALKNGYNSLTDKQKAELGTKTFVALSFGASQINNFVNSGKILGGTFKKTDDGLKFTLSETLTGTDQKSVDNAKQVIKESGVSKETEKAAEEALEEIKEAAKEGREDTVPDPEPDPKPEDRIPTETGGEFIDRNKEIKEDDFDIDEFLENYRELLEELYDISATDTEWAGTEPDETEPEQTEEQTEEEDETLSLSRVLGSYTVSGTDHWDDMDPDYSTVEDITLDVSFWSSDGQSISMTLNGETFGPRKYDGVIATCSFEDEEGFVIFVSFKEEGDTVRATLSYDQIMNDGRSYGTLTGTKN